VDWRTKSQLAFSRALSLDAALSDLKRPKGNCSRVFPTPRHARDSETERIGADLPFTECNILGDEREGTSATYEKAEGLAMMRLEPSQLMGSASQYKR
jgi:hypothetical protein